VCGVLQCAAVCCSVLQHVAVCCMSQCVAVFFSSSVYNYIQLKGVCVAVCCVFQRVAVCCSVLQCVAVCCSVLQCVALCCSVLQCVTVCCSVLQCVACCSVLQSLSRHPNTHPRCLCVKIDSTRKRGEWESEKERVIQKRPWHSFIRDLNTHSKKRPTLGAWVRRGCTRFQTPCLVCLKEKSFSPTIGYAGRRRPTWNTEICTNFLNFIIIQMHAFRKPRTYV